MFFWLSFCELLMTKEKITVILYMHTHAHFKNIQNWQRKGHVMRRSCNKTIINVYSWMNISLLFSLSFVSFRMLISAIPCQPHMLQSSFSLHTISYISDLRFYRKFRTSRWFFFSWFSLIFRWGSFSVSLHATALSIFSIIYVCIL